MQKITPHLWFDTQAKEAAAFYVSLLPDSKITSTAVLHDTPSGDCDIVSFEFAGQPFMAISAGPLFKFNPSVSFHIKCSTVEEVDELWKKLFVGGTALMELGEYPFSKRYGWLKDKFGVSWQIIYAGDQSLTQRITPVLMYVGDNCGKAEEAITFYASVFAAHGDPAASKATVLMRYSKEQAPEKEGNVAYATFTLNGQEFGAMDSGQKHEFNFNEAISLVIPCDTQEEVDYFWEKLSADPSAEQCGWLKDRYGLSWQVWPTVAGKMLSTGTREQVDRVTKAFLPMKKFNIAELERAFNGE